MSQDDAPLEIWFASTDNIQVLKMGKVGVKDFGSLPQNEKLWIFPQN